MPQKDYILNLGFSTFSLPKRDLKAIFSLVKRDLNHVLVTYWIFNH